MRELVTGGPEGRPTTQHGHAGDEAERGEHDVFIGREVIENSVNAVILSRDVPARDRGVMYHRVIDMHGNVVIVVIDNDGIMRFHAEMPQCAQVLWC
jgi:hypothetical protein